MESIPEIWKDVVGYEGEYQVSSSGRVRSLDRYVKSARGKRLVRGITMQLMKHPHGYRSVSLRGVNRVLVHRLVAEAFIGAPPRGCTDVNHINGVKHDNRVQNIEYCTRRQNVRHAMATGLMNNSGENNGQAKYKRSDIAIAYAMYAEGSTAKEASRKTGIPVSAIFRATSGRHWGFPKIAKGRHASQEIA